MGLGLVGSLLIGGSAVFHGNFAVAAQHPRQTVGTTSLAPPTTGPGRWIAAWAASPQAASQRSRFVTGFDDQTVRNVLFSSIGGSMIRVRFTNAFGAAPLQIGHATVAIHARGAPSGAQNDAATDVRRAAVDDDPGRRRGAVRSCPTDRCADAGARRQRVPATPDRPADRAWSRSAVQLRGIGRPRRRFRRRRRIHARTLTWYLVDDVDVIPPAREIGTIVAIGRLDHRRRAAPPSAPTPAGPTTSPGGFCRQFGCHAERGRRGHRRKPRAQRRSVLRRQRGGPLRSATGSAHAGVKAVILLEGVNDIGFSQSNGWLTAPHSNVTRVADHRRLRADHRPGPRGRRRDLRRDADAVPRRALLDPGGEAKREDVNTGS